MDPSRCNRPVFLSYSHLDAKIANGLRRNLEARDIPAWYAPSALQVGEDWGRKIDQAIDQARIFIPVVTDNYIQSGAALAELIRFHRRLRAEPEPTLSILPVVAGLSENGRQHGYIRPILERFHYLDLSVGFVDKLTVLLGRIQMILGREFVQELQRKAPIGVGVPAGRLA